MSTEVRIGLLALGALLLLTCIVISALKLGPRSARVLLGLFGAGLLGWGITLQLLMPQAAPSATAGAAAVGAPAATPASAAAAPLAPPRPDLTLLTSSAFSDCARPADPANPPDGMRASRAEMLAAQRAMQAYDAAISAYTRCLDTAADRILVQYRDAVPETELRAVQDMNTKIHDAAVDQDTAFVNRFNQQLRAFQARQGSAQNPLPTAP